MDLDGGVICLVHVSGASKGQRLVSLSLPFKDLLREARNRRTPWWRRMAKEGDEIGKAP